MIALFSALLGFLSSAFPDLIRLFREGKDRAHELEILQLQLQYDQQKMALQNAATQALEQTKLQEITLQTQSAAYHAATLERQALNGGAGNKEGMIGIRWVDGLSGSVRPVLTYAFFILYAGVKASQLVLLLRAPLPWRDTPSLAQAFLSLWTPDDMGIFSAIVAFWFGSRALARGRV